MMSIARRLRQWTNVQVLRSPNTDRQHDALKLAGLTLPVAVPEQWVVDGRCVGDGSKALLTLSRYLYRGVIREKDILRCEDGKVTYQCRDAKTGKMAQRMLAGEDFLWLVLQHVLPNFHTGLRRSRNFGYLHPNSAGAIRVLQVLHLRSVSTATPPPPARPTWRCACGQPMVVLQRRMPALQAVAQVEANNRRRAQTPRVTLPDKPCTAKVNTTQH